MAKKLLIITILLVTSFSLMAQWTCETIDPEFDNARKVAFTQDNNGNQLIVGDYLLLGIKPIGGYCTFSSIGDAVDYISLLLLRYICEVNGLNWANWTENEIESKSFGLWSDSVWSGPGNIPMVLAVEHNYPCTEDDYCSIYSLEISFKIGETYKRYRNLDCYDMEDVVTMLEKNEFVVSYKYDRSKKIGAYQIEWPSKEFWKDFKAASSVKFRIKHYEDSDYQYYEFNMNGSAKAFNFVTANHKVCWLEDWIENKEKELEKAELQKELKEMEKQKEKEKEEAEMQRELANLTPPHELKFECTERNLHLIYPDFYLYPLSDSVICGTRKDLEYNEEYDTILNIMGLCPCFRESIEAIEKLGEGDNQWYNGNDDSYDLNNNSKSCCWELDGIHIWKGNMWKGEREGEVVVPFKDISQYDWEERYCAFLKWTYAGKFVASGSLERDTTTKYQITWAQNPLKLIITDNNKTKEYIVKDWVVNKSWWQDGDWRYYVWSYNLLSDNGERYNVYIRREIIDPKSWGADWPMWNTNIGQELLFDHWQIPSNIFFKHTEIHEDDYLEIVK